MLAWLLPCWNGTAPREVPGGMEVHCQWCGCCSYVPGKKEIEKNIVGNEKMAQAHLEGSDGRMQGMVSVATQTVSTLSVATQTMEDADEVFDVAETQKVDFQVALLCEEAASVGSSIDGSPQRFGFDVPGVQQSPTNEAEQSQGCDAEFAPCAEVSVSYTHLTLPTIYSV